MSMKYLYVCVSSNEDSYLEQAFASIVTLKAKVPDAFVSLLVDRDTEKSLVEGRERIKDIIDEFVAIEFAVDISKKVRSRLLKTNMRNLIDGDFLFIDTDTFIFQDLTAIEKLPASFAGVQDKHCPLSKNDQVHTLSLSLKLVFSNFNAVNEETFINSGVLLVRDTRANRDFFKDWNREYEKWERKGITQDMPSLAFVNYNHSYCIAELEGPWNCQLESGAAYFRSAKIFHYYASHITQKSLTDLFQYIRNSKFDEAAKKYILENYERVAFDFGTSALVTGVEQEILKTACYRFLVFLYRRVHFVFSICERILSLGRGKGLYFKSKKGYSSGNDCGGI